MGKKNSYGRIKETAIRRIFMSKSDCHIQKYEEILKLRGVYKTKITDRLGFAKEKTRDSLNETIQNRKRLKYGWR